MYRVMREHFRISYPEFLPSPVENRRNDLFTELVHADMLERRLVLDIPEFYVGRWLSLRFRYFCELPPPIPGSILAITMSDPNMSDRKNRFVGICINRHKEGLHHQITLRNHIDGLGIEVMYELYTPTILLIEVLKLEKRLDDDLTYLQDALPEYSTFDFNMEPIPHPAGKPVPVNDVKVKLRPPPWRRRWEVHDFKGAFFLFGSFNLCHPIQVLRTRGPSRLPGSSGNSTGYEQLSFTFNFHSLPAIPQLQTSRNSFHQKYDIIRHYRDASQSLEHDLDVQQRIRQFEADKAEAGVLKKKILRTVAAPREASGGGDSTRAPTRGSG